MVGGSFLVVWNSVTTAVGQHVNNPVVSLELLCFVILSCLFVAGVLFLALQVFCRYVLDSGFMFLWDSCVCVQESVYLCIYMYFLCFPLGLFLVWLFRPILICLFLIFSYCMLFYYYSSQVCVCFLTRDRKGVVQVPRGNEQELGKGEEKSECIKLKINLC